jgi:heme exporter protein D
MNRHSTAEFFAMRGYAPYVYVWGSFGVCALALALEPFLLNRRGRAILRSLRWQALAEQMDQEAG